LGTLETPNAVVWPNVGLAVGVEEEPNADWPNADWPNADWPKAGDAGVVDVANADGLFSLGLLNALVADLI
jgi:hypothetical protein